MFTLTTCSVGTVDVVRTEHATFDHARYALMRFARAYDVHGTTSGTLTTRTGRVNQASYTWSIRRG